ncbi:MAG: CHAT domain-containing protein, partial [Ekhidna sp.]|nr:CHAT domain-containing protein [Ekhidna sp.]
LATHGKYYGSEGTADIDKFSLDKQIKFDENPLLRSHIYLSGSNNALSGKHYHGEDGILTGEEASHLDLAQTQLVVLSACESGLGQAFTGEGVFGLQRAFLQAGAKNMIITLWEVSDFATQEFMRHFYENWLEQGMTIRNSFLAARSQLRQKRTIPKYWAPFILIGQ